VTVVHEPCEECGFSAPTFEPSEVAATIRGFGRRYRAPLTRLLPGEDGDAVVRGRADGTTWSALEYAAHVRDVLAFWSWGLHQTVTGDGFVLPRPDPDQVAADSGYADLDAAQVADELAANAERFATEVEKVPAEGWDRTCEFRGERVDARWMVSHAVHEGHHHLLDVGRVLREVRGR
jgi:hypothetical protein